jgi:hypothetical protein
MHNKVFVIQINVVKMYPLAKANQSHVPEDLHYQILHQLNVLVPHAPNRIAVAKAALYLNKIQRQLVRHQINNWTPPSSV